MMRLDVMIKNEIIKGNSVDYLKQVINLIDKYQVDNISFINPVSKKELIKINGILVDEREMNKNMVNNINNIFDNLVQQRFLANGSDELLSNLMNKMANEFILNENVDHRFNRHALKNSTIIKNNSIKELGGLFLIAVDGVMNGILGEIKLINNNIRDFKIKEFSNALLEQKEVKQLEKGKRNCESTYNHLETLRGLIKDELDGLNTLLKRGVSEKNLQEVISNFSLNNIDFDNEYIIFVPRIKYMNIANVIREELLSPTLTSKTLNKVVKQMDIERE